MYLYLFTWLSSGCLLGLELFALLNVFNLLRFEVKLLGAVQKSAKVMLHDLADTHTNSA